MQLTQCGHADTPMHSIDPFSFQSSPLEEISVTTKPSISTLQTTLIGNVVKPGSPAAAGIKPSTPATSLFPVGTLADFLKAIQGCDKNKEAMLQDLYTQFKSATTQKVIKQTFGLVADREKGRNGRWVVKHEAWVSAMGAGYAVTIYLTDLTFGITTVASWRHPSHNAQPDTDRALHLNLAFERAQANPPSTTNLLRN
jgi:hypothetical protein